MNIDKAIRKQKKSYKRFMLSMCFIFFVLPTALIFYKKFEIFYISYLVIIETLIILAVAIRYNKEKLDFEYNGYRLNVKAGIGKRTINILCDKIVLVHAENIVSKEEGHAEFKIVMISTSRFRSKRMLPISVIFLKNNPYLAHKYNKLKTLNLEQEYFYTIIKKGGIKKYPFLDTIYKSCVYADFTEETIEKIKFYRENSDNYCSKSNK